MKVVFSMRNNKNLLELTLCWPLQDFAYVESVRFNSY